LYNVAKATFEEVQKFRRRFVKLMDRLINLLENDLEFYSFHLDGQFQSIMDYLEIRSENEPRIKSVSKMIGNRGTTKHVLLMNGIDHSFAQENICEVIKLINQEIPEVHAIHGSMADYTNAVLEAHEKEKIPFTQFKGEMFDLAESPVLLDCHSTHIDVKIWNNMIENLYERWMEPFAAYAWLLG